MVMFLAVNGDDSDDDGDDADYACDGGGDDCDHRNEGVANAQRNKPKPPSAGILLFTERAHMASFVPSII